MGHPQMALAVFRSTSEFLLELKVDEYEYLKSGN